MPTSVALSPHFGTFIRQQVDSGSFNNVSEVDIEAQFAEENHLSPTGKPTRMA